MHSLSFTNGWVLGLAALAGCTVSTRSPADDRAYPADDRDFADTASPPRSSGIGSSSAIGDDAELGVDWSIDGSTDPLACDDNGVAYAYILIEDDVGTVDEVEVDCDAFEYVSPPMPPGLYWATVALRDERHRDLTEAAMSDRHDLPPGASDSVSVEFPLDSFVAP
jgi:hypothetical protein